MDMINISENQAIELFSNAGATNAIDASIARERVKKEKNSLEIDIEILAKNFISNPTAETFGPIYKRLFYGMRKYAFKFVQDLETAEEMVLVTFEKVWSKYDQFNPDIAKFSTWIYNILRYECLGYLNKKNAQNYVNSDISDLYSSTIAEACEAPLDSFEVKGMDIRMLNREEIIQKVYDVSLKEIQLLEPNIRMVITEKLIKGKKLEEVAAEQGIPCSSVKNWLRKARLTIRERFQTKYKDLYDLYLDVAGDSGTYLI